MGRGDGAAAERWSRRLSTRETAFWYSFAFVSYVACAIYEKGLLTWIVGPLWLVAVVVYGPVLADRLRRRS